MPSNFPVEGSENSGKLTVPVAGLEVKFPYKPYSQQIGYMEHGKFYLLVTFESFRLLIVLEALNHG